MKKWRGRAPKKRRNEGIETAIKMVVYPVAIAVGIVSNNKRKKRGKKK